MVLVVVGQDGNLDVKLQHEQVAQHTGMLKWLIVSPEGESLFSGYALKNESSTVRAKLAPGIYGVVGDAQLNCWNISAPNHAWAIRTPVHLMSRIPPQYFWVPAGIEQFSVTGNANSTVETATMTIRDPDGKQAAQVTTVDTTDGSATAQVRAPKRFQGKVWSIVLSKGAIGHLEDVSISLGEKLLPYLSPEPSRMIISK